jgi:hypothetical protein
MVLAFVITTTVSAFAASTPSYTTTPKANEVLYVMTPSMTAATIIYHNVTCTITRDGIINAYTPDWGVRCLKTNQAYVVSVPRNIIPGDIRFTKYTYNSLTKKFTKVVTGK